MNDQIIMDIVREAFYYVMLICGPILAISLIVGLIISVFQAATSISEQTLTFVPKLLAVFVVTILFLPFMLDKLKTYFVHMFTMMITLK